MSQQYSLRWNNHQPNFISMFTSLLNTQTLVDVTLAAEGKHLQAHKVVLSACSTYFQALFVDNPSRHPIVILKDVSFADLRTMVDFMYYGEVNVTEEQLPQVLDTAKLLKIKGLTEMPDSTSLTRSQGTTADFQSPGESAESQRHSASPSISPLNRRKRRRASSTGSTCLNVIQEENRNDEMGQLVDLVKAESVILSNLQQRRPKDNHDDRIDNAQQTGESQHLLEPLAMESNVGLSQGQWSMMEHTYPRYSNACVASGGLQPEPGMYNMNVINPHINEMNNYPQGIGVVGPSVGVGCVNTDNQGAQEQATPTPPKRRRTTNPQSEENFQRALEAVRFGGIGFCKAARMFGVNNRTLWLEYKKKGYPNNRPSIKSRIKREHTTPPPEHKEESLQPEQQMALICPPHPMPVGFIDSRPLDFPLQETQSLLMVRQRNQRLKFRRQNRVEPDEREMKKQISEPLPPIAVVHTLQKHDSYPQYTPLKSKRREQAVGSLLIRAVTVKTSPSTSHDNVVTEASGQTQRASHTPAVRSGPPLSCNFCWNTVDDCGRILRRKTQYHCPECRTNLCIVPCFHEYHDGAETDTPVNASASARFYYNHTKNV